MVSAHPIGNGHTAKVLDNGTLVVCSTCKKISDKLAELRDGRHLTARAEAELDRIQEAIDKIQAIRPARDIDPATGADLYRTLEQIQKRGGVAIDELPPWLRKLFDEGNAFDDAMARHIDDTLRAKLAREHPDWTPQQLDAELKGLVGHEVVVDVGGQRFRLDSYDLDAGEIISRKFTQLDQVRPETVRGYINEMLRKYPEGALIVNADRNIGDALAGTHVLQIPDQSFARLAAMARSDRMALADALQHARKNNVVIRTANGTVLSSGPFIRRIREGT